jgi:hypothetical protein
LDFGRFFLRLVLSSPAWADPTQFYNRSFVLPANTSVVDQDGQTVQFGINTNMIIEDHTVQNGELVYQFRQPQRSGSYFLRAIELKKISGLEDCDVPVASSNLRNIHGTQKSSL